MSEKEIKEIIEKLLDSGISLNVIQDMWKKILVERLMNE